MHIRPQVTKTASVLDNEASRQTESSGLLSNRLESTRQDTTSMEHKGTVEQISTEGR